MALGLQPQKGDIDILFGGLCRDLNNAAVLLTRTRSYLGSKDDASLVAMGWSSGEVTAMRSALGDLGLLGRVYDGTVTADDFVAMGATVTAGAVDKGSAKDLRANVAKVWGVGF